MSGYQESLVRVQSLAEAAGILRAFSEWNGAFCWAHGVEQAIRNVSPDSPSTLGSMLRLPSIPLKRGQLFVVICGDRHPYQFCSGRWRYLDGIADEVKDSYRSYLVPVPDEEVLSSWSNDSRLAERSYSAWKEYLENAAEVWDQDVVDPRHRFSEVVFGIGVNPPASMGIDPDPIFAIAGMLRERGITGGVINGKIPADALFS
ncbi:MAG: hypothetical protein ACOYJL_05520 [Tractidigestivibacter sp.]|jgi:hypothetical protein|uniref:hypothetical protein n=1 Tax=Tractidigestivibacter sp. TaxID=2847320 RepID=UPI003D90748F